MTIYRGGGGTGEATTDTDITEVRAVALEAEGYRDQAATSASNASASASAAATSASNAASSASSASSSASSAASNSSTATAQAALAESARLAAQAAQAAAETAETNAETAETNAETAQAAAEAARNAAEAVYDDFDDRYLGNKSSNPTVDNDGNPLLVGALYFNTVAPEMRVYNGTTWQNFSAASAVSSFNGRTGAITLTSSDVTTALTYTPLQTETDPIYTASSWYGTTNNSSNWNTAYSWGNHASAGYALDSAVVKLTGDQTIAGTKTFSSTISGSISGNAGTVTNGVYTTGDQTIGGTKTFSSNPVLTSGSVNGVVYLNGSKVLTTGSALTFDGTNVALSGAMSIGGASLSAGNKLLVRSGLSDKAIGVDNGSNSGFVVQFASGLTSIGNDFNAPLAFLQNNTEQMRLTSTGLGIGTSSPNFNGVTGTVCHINNANTNAWSLSHYTNGTTGSGAADGLIVGYTTDGSNAYVFNYENAGILFGTNGAERARIDSSGNVGIGTSSLSGSYRLHTAGTNPGIAIQNTGSGGGWIDFLNSSGTVRGNIYYDNTSGYMTFGTSASGAFTERARIDSSGNLLVGTTSSIVANTFVSSNTNGTLSTRNTNTAAGQYFRFGHDQNNNFIVLNQSAAGVYLTNGGTTWTSLSDERTKDIIEPIANAAAKVVSLRAVIGKYKTDEEGVRRSFLIAQDVQAVLPEAVNVQPDEQGTLGLQYTDLIPLLTAAIQEQQMLIEDQRDIINAQTTALNQLKARLDAANL